MEQEPVFRHPPSTTRHPVIAITMGDPGGIGPETIVKTLLEQARPSECQYVVIGSPMVFSFLRENLNLDFPFKPMTPWNPAGLEAGEVGLLSIEDGPFDIGKETLRNGRMAFQAIAKAAELAHQGLVQGIVTAPLHKAAVRLEHKDFIGHTEFLAQRSGAKQFAMMFVGSKLKVTLVTTHVPLKKVSEALNEESIAEKIKLTYDALLKGFSIPTPRIGVCALNPHGKECGTGEEEIIQKAVKRAEGEGVKAAGPFSADQLFYAAYHGAYDALVCMYHDQALGPFKMIHFHDGVNVTLGLPFIRTSPDHGTAYDIAYQGKADPASLKAALGLAEKMVLTKHA